MNIIFKYVLFNILSPNLFFCISIEFDFVIFDEVLLKILDKFNYFSIRMNRDSNDKGWEWKMKMIIK